MNGAAEKPARIALVTQRFWPQVGGVETAIANLAAEFRRQGHRATIIAPQWEKCWPRELVHREIPVLRLPPAPQSGWGTLRYMYSLSRWLKRSAGKFDALLVAGLRHDAHCAIGALHDSRVPVVLRAEGAGATGECKWQRDVRFGMRIRRRCQQAAAIVAPSDACAAELREAGFDAERIVRIDNGVPLPELRSPLRRDAARTALGTANHDLTSKPESPVVVAIGRLHATKGLLDLVNAWPKVLHRHAGAKLWIVGEGPERERLFARIGDLGLKYQICLPGAFDDVEELLQAADLFVAPAYEQRTSLGLLEAMAAGVPVIASDIPAHRACIAHEATGLLYPARDARALSAAMLRAIDRPDEAVKLGAAARSIVEQRFSIARMATQHLDLIRRLCARNPQAATSH